MRMSALGVLVWLWAGSASAQGVCRDYVSPSPVSGHPQGLIWLAPESDTYPAHIAYPVGATRFSIVSWYSFIPTHEAGVPVPAGSVQMREYLERPPFGTGQDFHTLAMVLVPGEKFFGRSRPILPNTAYTVWVGNTNPFWVPVYLIIDYQLCGV